MDNSQWAMSNEKIDVLIVPSALSALAADSRANPSPLPIANCELLIGRFAAPLPMANC
jgi:hypothetical protein